MRKFRRLQPARYGISFSFSPGVCQSRNILSNNFPRTAPRFETFIPAGRSGWMKLFAQAGQGIVGATINFNPNAASTSGSFNQGHNLHKMTLQDQVTISIPIFPPSCQ